MNRKLERIKAELKDPKKASMIALLLVVALLLWGRFLMEHVPEMATAGPAAPVSSSVDGSGELSGPIAPMTPDKPVVSVELAEGVSRDLFRLPRDKYEAVEDETNGQEPEKSSAEPTDDRGWLRAVRQAADELSLQSVVTGDAPRAIINGQVVAPGERINGFTVVRVAERFVLIEKDGVKVRLNL